MRRGRPVPMVAVLVIIAVWPAAAAAAGGTRRYNPPGKAGANQYFETLPTAGGGVAPPANNTPSSPATLAHLGHAKSAAHKLKKLGKDGQAVLAFAQATAPTRVRPTYPGSTNSATQTAAKPRVGSGGSAISGVLRVLGGSDSGGIGVFLPLLLAFGLGAAAGVMLVRVRRGRRASA